MFASKYLLYRILGNDIPLRHQKGQTLRNLRRILEGEEGLKGLKMRWLLNRIADQEVQAQIIKLLDKYQQKYEVIPFNLGKFKRIPVDDLKSRTAELIGLNQARNKVLRQGQKLAEWTMVFDGNCFLTSQAWQEIIQAIESDQACRYGVVAMIRIIKGKPAVLSEPQLMFRFDANEKFDEAFEYGQDSKIELLRRLNVSGVWDQWSDSLKKTRKKHKIEGSVCYAGHVLRLPSGNELAEKDIKIRKQLRDRGIIHLMNRIDQW